MSNELDKILACIKRFLLGQPYLFYSLQPTGTGAAGAAGSVGGLRRCRALYDCEADNEDELSFREGEVIVVTNEHTDDENWVEGALEREPDRRGMFPLSFVHMLQE